MNKISALSAKKNFDCKVIVVSNCKGGTGKSTTAINLGIGLANKGYRVLLVDNDPQGSMSLGLGIDNPDMLDHSLATALVKMITGEQINPREGIVRHEEGVDLIPGNIELCGLEVELVEKGIKEALRKYLSFHKNDYDYIIVDCQPSLSQLTLNAFAAADSIIVPVQASYLPVKGLEQFISAVNQVKGPLNPMLRIEGILLTMVDNRTNNSKEIIRLLHKNIGGNVRIFKTNIPFSVKAAESTSKHRSIYKHAPRCKVAEAYHNLTEEVLEA